MQTLSTDQLLNLTDLRAILGGRSRTAIYRDMEAGRIPAPVKIGGRIYWRRSDVDSFLASPGVSSLTVGRAE